MKKIYDCFMFNNELSLLEIRLNILAEVVDEFVIVELNKTHSGTKKPYNLENNDGYIKGFEDFKIDLVQLEVPDNFTHPWQIENQHRRHLQIAADRFSSDDIVMISDLDEIPDPEVVRHFYLGRYEQSMYYFYLNAYAHPWSSGTVVLPQWLLMQRDIQLLRNEGHQNRCTLPKIPNAGWHFSSVGKVEDILNKMTSFAHTEYSTLGARETVLQNRHLLNDIHGEPLQIVDIDSTYPKYLQKTWQDKWRHLVYESRTI